MVGPSLFSRLASTLLHPLAPQDVLSLLDPVHSSRQLRGVVTSVTRETPGTATIAFRPGPGWRAHDAGQWARIGVDVDGVRQWRSYSLSAPAGADPEITVSDIGLVSGTLVRHTKPGDVLFLDIPEGDFTLPDEPRPLLMLTAGSGLTPVMSMIRTLVPARADADVVLIHSSRTPEDALFREEETFGPVVPVFAFDGEEEVLDKANASDLGLASYLFTRDLNRAMRLGRRIEAGMCGINTGIISTAVAPFGGVKQSGYGREGSQHGIEEYVNIRAVTLALG